MEPMVIGEFLLLYLKSESIPVHACNHYRQYYMLQMYKTNIYSDCLNDQSSKRMENGLFPLEQSPGKLFAGWCC